MCRVCAGIFKTPMLLSMSDYFASLDSVARSRYLELLGIEEKSEPYASDADDMSPWPSVDTWTLYLIERPGFYTKQQLMQWKSLDAYSYLLVDMFDQYR